MPLQTTDRFEVLTVICGGASRRAAHREEIFHKTAGASRRGARSQLISASKAQDSASSNIAACSRLQQMHCNHNNGMFQQVFQKVGQFGSLSPPKGNQLVELMQKVKFIFVSADVISRSVAKFKKKVSGYEPDICLRT